MNITLRNLGMSALGVVFMSLAWSKDRLRGYATPNTVRADDTEGKISYLFDILDTFRRFLPPGFTFAGRDILEVSPGSSRGLGVLFLALGARSYQAIDAFALAADESPEFYETLLQRFPDGTPEDRARALRLVTSGHEGEFGYTVGRDFDIPRLTDGRRFDLIVSCAAFEHYDDVADTIRGLSRVARSGCRTLHIIDFQTHSRWIREADPTNIYRYRESFYRLFRFPGQPNRHRPETYRRLFAEAGWQDVRFTPARTIAPGLREASLTGLAPPFCDMPDMDVLDGAVTGLWPAPPTSP